MQRGASLIEYVILLAFIVMAAVVATRAFGVKVNDNFEKVIETEGSPFRE